ncbi:R-spondin 3 [Sarotherodon galilaeus]
MDNLKMLRGQAWTPKSVKMNGALLGSFSIGSIKIAREDPGDPSHWKHLKRAEDPRPHISLTTMRSPQQREEGGHVPAFCRGGAGSGDSAKEGWLAQLIPVTLTTPSPFQYLPGGSSPVKWLMLMEELEENADTDMKRECLDTRSGLWTMLGSWVKMDSFSHAHGFHDWETLCEPHLKGINELIECITEYITFYIDSIFPARTVRCYPNNKPLVTEDIKSLLNDKNGAFRVGNKEEEETHRWSEPLDGGKSQIIRHAGVSVEEPHNSSKVRSEKA